MKTITIPVEEYIGLLVDSERLGRLECGGIDNWEWYSESLNPRGEDSIGVFEARLKLKHGVELTNFDKEELAEAEEENG